MKKANMALKIVYDVVISLIITASITLTVLGFAKVISLSESPYFWINLGLTGILGFDYFYRFFTNKHKLKFFKRTFVELISILPFSSVFCFFRIFRIIGFTHVGKKMMEIADRMTIWFKKSREAVGSFLNTNGFLQILEIVLLILVVSAEIVSCSEDITFANALWWAIVTCTTVGYGDVTPTGVVGKSVAIVLMVVGVGFMSTLTGTITSYFQAQLKKRAENSERSSANSAHGGETDEGGSVAVPAAEAGQNEAPVAATSVAESDAGDEFAGFKQKYDALSEEQKRAVNELLTAFKTDS